MASPDLVIPPGIADTCFVGIGRCFRAFPLPHSAFVLSLGPHRLEAQDTALSRRRQGFESPWGYWSYVNSLGPSQLMTIARDFFFLDVPWGFSRTPDFLVNLSD